MSEADERTRSTSSNHRHEAIDIEKVTSLNFRKLACCHVFPNAQSKRGSPYLRIEVNPLKNWRSEARTLKSRGNLSDWRANSALKSKRYFGVGESCEIWRQCFAEFTKQVSAI